MLVNTPQLILSLLYFAYNSIVTSVFLSRELCHFAYERKGLRVSLPEPEGAQRNTYFLSIP